MKIGNGPPERSPQLSLITSPRRNLNWALCEDVQCPSRVAVYEEDYKEILKICCTKKDFVNRYYVDVLMESFNEGRFVSKRPLAYWFRQSKVLVF